MRTIFACFIGDSCITGVDRIITRAFIRSRCDHGQDISRPDMYTILYVSHSRTSLEGQVVYVWCVHMYRILL